MQDSLETPPQESFHNPEQTSEQKTTENHAKIRQIILAIMTLAIFAGIFTAWLHIMDYLTAPLPQNDSPRIFTTPSSNCVLEMADSVDISISAWTDLNGQTKNRILRQRKTTVAEYFAQTGAKCTEGNYQPSEHAFGQIENDRPWIGEDAICSSSDPFGTTTVISGKSEESAYLNNPLTLLAHETLYYELDDCSEDQYYQLDSFSYDATSRKFTLTYLVPNFINDRLEDEPISHLLNGINAVDMGYSFINVYAADGAVAKGAPEQVYQMANFIHLGGSCQISGGCNNGSPFQDFMQFDVFSLPATISAKLWHKHPASPYIKADYYFDIILKPRTTTR
ncbi:hypothetical protein FWH09_02565 [Candidatus Saccharibacteria bacterium]|nr:hypothetical protein [Candidatus Saccharibacteria bacterium]